MHRRRKRLFSPSQLFRQAGAVVLYGLLTRWRYMPHWLLSAKSLLPLVAGSEGMGCIGFPTHPVIEVTQRCNLQCVHCHADSDNSAESELSLEEMRLLLRGIAAQPEFKMVVFSGGEPLMREDIVELCDYASWSGLWPVIATNGTLLDAVLAKRLRRAGLCGVAVGLDGHCPAVHDKIRGEDGAFRRAIEGCIVARRAGLPLQVNITLMQQNYEWLPKIIRLSEHLGAEVVLVYFCAPCGRGESNEQILLSPEQYEASLRRIAELQRAARMIIEPVCAPTYWAMLGRRDWLSSLAVRSLGPIFFHGCVAGSGLFYVRADGEALPCPFLPVSAGNVADEGVSKLWEQGEVFEALRRLKNSPRAPNCSSCNFHRVCGGCRGKAFSAYGDVSADDPFCFLADRPESELPSTPKRPD